MLGATATPLQVTAAGHGVIDKPLLPSRRSPLVKRRKCKEAGKASVMQKRIQAGSLTHTRGTYPNRQ